MKYKSIDLHCLEISDEEREELVRRAEEYFVPIMIKVELVLFVFHFVLALFILTYLAAEPIRKVYLSKQANFLLGVLLSTQLLHMISELESYFRSDSDCRLTQRLNTSTIEFMLFTVQIILAFEFLYAANQIYRFSKCGILPQESKKRALRNTIFVVWLSSISVAICYSTAITIC